MHKAFSFASSGDSPSLIMCVMMRSMFSSMRLSAFPFASWNASGNCCLHSLIVRRFFFAIDFSLCQSNGSKTLTDNLPNTVISSQENSATLESCKRDDSFHCYSSGNDRRRTSDRVRKKSVREHANRHAVIYTSAWSRERHRIYLAGLDNVVSTNLRIEDIRSARKLNRTSLKRVSIDQILLRIG